MNNVINMESWLFNKVETLTAASDEEINNGDQDLGVELAILGLDYAEKLERIVNK